MARPDRSRFHRAHRHDEHLFFPSLEPRVGLMLRRLETLG